MNTNELLDFQDRLRGFAYKKGGDPADDAAETISICLEKGYDKLPNDEFTRVAFAVCSNLIKNRFRRKSLDVKYFPVVASADSTTDDTSDVSFFDLIAGLDKLEQQILTLNMVEGLRMHEVAEQVGLTYGMARKAKMIAIAKLRDRFATVAA